MIILGSEDAWNAWPREIQGQLLGMVEIWRGTVWRRADAWGGLECNCVWCGQARGKMGELSLARSAYLTFYFALAGLQCSTLTPLPHLINHFTSDSQLTNSIIINSGLWAAVSITEIMGGSVAPAKSGYRSFEDDEIQTTWVKVSFLHKIHRHVNSTLSFSSLEYLSVSSPPRVPLLHLFRPPCVLPLCSLNVRSNSNHLQCLSISTSGIQSLPRTSESPS
jgi:hypothetical protein